MLRLKASRLHTVNGRIAYRRLAVTVCVSRRHAPAVKYTRRLCKHTFSSRQADRTQFCRSPRLLRQLPSEPSVASRFTALPMNQDKLINSRYLCRPYN